MAELERKVDMFEQYFRAFARGKGDGSQVVRVAFDGQEMILTVPAGEPVDLAAVVDAVHRQRQSDWPPQPPLNSYTGPRPVSG